MLALAVDALATFRLTRLVVEDHLPIMDDFRAAVRKRYDEDTWQSKLIECPWCVSFWIGVGVVGARAVAPRQWQPLAKAFAFSAVAGIISSKVE